MCADARVGEVQRERERENPQGAVPLSVEPDVGPDPGTLRSLPEPKSRV